MVELFSGASTPVLWVIAVACLLVALARLLPPLLDWAKWWDSRKR